MALRREVGGGTTGRRTPPLNPLLIEEGRLLAWRGSGWRGEWGRTGSKITIKSKIKRQPVDG
jgi:hypothetical protein